MRSRPQLQSQVTPTLKSPHSVRQGRQGKAVPNEVNLLPGGSKLKIGVVLSRRPAPGGHNVISGIFGSVVYGFRGGPVGIMKGKYIELTPEYIYPYRNQFMALLASPIQFVGPTSTAVNHTLLLELGAQV
ncbi:hypothetical protein Pint_09575 [Pistacia integerrima]|uniref:Uncharacterized protein n=1 Tax=Pistacia integerrima TaxID=434235 RepID=A0ACC0XIE8_9ROSI|nr:hypothetical protein Pint_09575 [Pistacia integerrima]